MNTNNETSQIEKQENTLCLFIENKLGAIERVIGTFTLRGYSIENLICTKSKLSQLFKMKITLNCTDKELENLVKILHNQIHVLEIKLMMEENPSKEIKTSKVG